MFIINKCLYICYNIFRIFGTCRNSQKMSENREKLLNAVLFFTKETGHVNITKLMKLLNFFDFEHFNQTGYPSIGLEYYAFKQGPVPKIFWLEVKDGLLKKDLFDKIAVVMKTGDTGKRETEFRARRGAEVDFAIFTPREKSILEKLAYIYKDATAAMMSDISHEADRPWEITMKEKGLNAPIDYLLALDSKTQIDPEEANENLKDYFAYTKLFDLMP
jgi:uncharacterized phage-associated protein